MSYLQSILVNIWFHRKDSKHNIAFALYHSARGIHAKANFILGTFSRMRLARDDKRFEISPQSYSILNRSIVPILGEKSICGGFCACAKESGAHVKRRRINSHEQELEKELEENSARFNSHPATTNPISLAPVSLADRAASRIEQGQWHRQPISCFISLHRQATYFPASAAPYTATLRLHFEASEYIRLRCSARREGVPKSLSGRFAWSAEGSVRCDT